MTDHTVMGDGDQSPDTVLCLVSRFRRTGFLVIQVETISAYASLLR